MPNENQLVHCIVKTARGKVRTTVEVSYEVFDTLEKTKNADKNARARELYHNVLYADAPVTPISSFEGMCYWDLIGAKAAAEFAVCEFGKCFVRMLEAGVALALATVEGALIVFAVCNEVCVVDIGNKLPSGRGVLLVPAMPLALKAEDFQVEFFAGIVGWP